MSTKSLHRRHFLFLGHPFQDLRVLLRVIWDTVSIMRNLIITFRTEVSTKTIITAQIPPGPTSIGSGFLYTAAGTRLDFSSHGKAPMNGQVEDSSFRSEDLQALRIGFRRER